MNQEEIYRCWIQEKRRVEVDPEFVGRVMKQIAARTPQADRLGGRLLRLVDRINVSSWVQVAAVGIAFLVGLGRVLASLHLLLSV